MRLDVCAACRNLLNQGGSCHHWNVSECWVCSEGPGQCFLHHSIMDTELCIGMFLHYNTAYSACS